MKPFRARTEQQEEQREQQTDGNQIAGVVQFLPYLPTNLLSGERTRQERVLLYVVVVVSMGLKILRTNTTTTSRGLSQ